MTPTLRSFALFGLLTGAAPLLAAEPPPDPAEIVRTFEKAWGTPKGYMRPLDDAGWKARMTAFKQLAEAGDNAIPALTDALTNGEPETRVFAAQALSLMADPKAKPSLEAALKAKTPAARLYARDALGIFGKLAPTEELKAMKEKDPNRDVKAHVGFALDRDDKPAPAALRKQLRRQGRERSVSAINSSLGDELFDKAGWWQARPSNWPADPKEVLERKEFWDAFRQCLENLPQRLRTVFSLREMDELGTDDVCEAMKVTPGNLGVLLYRARMGLRRCLEINWFGTETEEG